MNHGRKALLQGMRLYLNNYEVYVHVDLAGARRLGKALWVNDKTTWLKVMHGAKTYDVIKRHNVKHNLRLHKVYSLERTDLDNANEHIHPTLGDQDKTD